MTAGVLLLVPLVYLVLGVSALQSATLGVEGAVRQASRVFVQQDTLGSAQAAADRAIRVTLADYGLEAGDAHVTVSCEPVSTDCLARRGMVTVEVSIVVPLPLMPTALFVETPNGVSVSASATAQVSRFRADA